MSDQEYLSEKTYMKVRLFRLAQKKWHLDFKECSVLFNQYHLYDVIDELYEEFHVQGDDVNLDERRKNITNGSHMILLRERSQMIIIPTLRSTFTLVEHMDLSGLKMQ